ncbi:MAG: hypothetical protein WCR70_04870, partial [Sphaerochaetaceae bacterium]
MAIKKPSEMTWEDIANIALLRNNMKPISSFEDGSQSAQVTKQMISQACSEVLNMNDWRSATLRAYLIPLADLTVDGKTAYNLPADFIRLVHVERDASLWSRESHRIVSEVGGSLLIRYVAFPELPGTLDPMLVSAIALMLAYKITISLTSDANI